MKEIEVVTDVRPNHNNPELIVVKQRIAACGDELTYVGEPAETRFDWPKESEQLKSTNRNMLADSLNNIKIHRLAQSVLDHIPEEKRFALMEQLVSLSGLPQDWNKDDARQLNSSKNRQLWLVQLASPWRAFIGVSEYQPLEVLDLIHEDLLSEFLKHQHVTDSDR